MRTSVTSSHMGPGRCPDPAGSQMFLLLLLVGGLLGLSCAGQMAPTGGPPDKTPPRVLETYPPAGTLHFRDTRFRLKFDKYVTQMTVEQAIFISPNAGQLSFDWSGKEVEIQCADTLRPNTTYILTLGSDAQDTHGNKFVQTFALPFSTGDKIDSASVSGRVFDVSPSGVMIFAYTLDGRNPDTLNPSHTKPDFLTQSGKDGNFSLTNLSPGAYRLIAVRDEYKNLVYDVQTDQYGVLPGDISLPAESSKVVGRQFRLRSSDTTSPFLSSARARYRTRVLLRFNKAMDPLTIDTANISIRDTLHGAPLRVEDVSLAESGLEAWAVTGLQESTAVYRVSMRNLRDIHGNALSLASSNADFTGSSLADTMAMWVKFLTGGDSLRGIDPADTLWLTFAKPVVRASVAGAITLADSALASLRVKLRWVSSDRAILQPPPLAYGSRYRLKVTLDSINVFGVKPFHDSTLVRHFFTIGEDQFGSIKGIISDQVRSAPGGYELIMTDAQKRSTPPVRLHLDSAGAFVWEHLREGKYLLWGFNDRDRRREYDGGEAYPYKPAERFAVYPDTLKIRIRWPLEGVQLRFTE